jgi:hypothetical protein
VEVVEEEQVMLQVELAVALVQSSSLTLAPNVVSAVQ